ncbi:EAL domain-containing protein [Bacillus sp. T33-2]|uniref:EAL domain-containing protein n=1 Tax=Bacillus sp. T33-2 TaxID=2054168 RepID=UPI00215546DA|nr:EAL domain-containing protein [Bacillus sp. T33-2]
MKLHFPTLETSENLIFSHVFQPIFSLQNNRVYGYESLLRGDHVQNPEMLFEMAVQQKKLFDLDMASMMQSIFTYDEFGLPKQKDLHLTVNVFPSTLLNPSFLWKLEKVMRKVDIPPQKIMLELNESETVTYVHKLQEIIRYLKKAGFIIALDDLGKGQSSLRIALELEPDAVKLDRYFCDDLQNSIKKQRFLNWIASYFREEGVSVTLEGIETESQLTIARQTGIDFGQGYFLGRPKPLI